MQSQSANLCIRPLGPTHPIEGTHISRRRVDSEGTSKGTCSTTMQTKDAQSPFLAENPPVLVLVWRSLESLGHTGSYWQHMHPPSLDRQYNLGCNTGTTAQQVRKRLLSKYALLYALLYRSPKTAQTPVWYFPDSRKLMRRSKIFHSGTIDCTGRTWLSVPSTSLPL